MRSVVVPTLTTFSRSRAWTRAQILHLQKIQNYALQRAFGLDKLAMHELHITNAQLHAAAQWPFIEDVIMEQSLRWLGHIARMPITRLPKIALFGTWLQAGTNSTHANTQIRWLSSALKKADIHHLEFFRLAQNKATTKWDALLRKAFPKIILTKVQGQILNAWRPGRPLPNFTPPHTRQTRTVWTPPASSTPHKTCPVCMKLFDTNAALNHHYLLNHAISDPNIKPLSQPFNVSNVRKSAPQRSRRLPIPVTLHTISPTHNPLTNSATALSTSLYYNNLPRSGDFSPMDHSTPTDQQRLDGGSLPTTLPITLIPTAYFASLDLSYSMKQINVSSEPSNTAITHRGTYSNCRSLDMARRGGTGRIYPSRGNSIRFLIRS